MEPLEHGQDAVESIWPQLDHRRGALRPTSSYVYEALNPGPSSVRLLQLHPSEDLNATIQASLQHTCLADKPVYEAISYVWGSLANLSTIFLEGLAVQITENLQQALRHLRRPTRIRVLWVDALCIDQSNAEERSRQVRLMRDIYSSCTADLVWIGQNDEWRTRGFEVAARLQRSDIVTLRRKVRKLRLAQRRELQDLEIKGAFHTISRDDWSALQMVFRFPEIWSRVWVMQEIACAPTVLLVNGDKTLDFDIVENFLDTENYPDAYHGPFYHDDYLALLEQTFTTTQIIMHQRRTTRRQTKKGRRKSRLLDVLARFRHSNASDPRDKIYGLLGLATDALHIVPDYTKSVVQVYVEFFEAYVNAEQDLDLICQNPWGFRRTSKGKRDDMALSSWCPDFSNSERSPPLLFAQRSIFCAGGKSCQTPIVVSNHKQLHLHAFVLGEVSLLHRPFKSDFDRDILLLPDDLNAIDEHHNPATYCHTDEPAFQAYWRTLIADCEAYPTKRLDDSSLQVHKQGFDEWRRRSNNSSSAPPPSSITIRAEIGMDTANRPGVSLTDRLAKYEEPQRSLLKVQYSKMLDKMTKHWQFAVAGEGVYCMVPFETEVGDRVVVLRGAKVPMVLQPMEPGEAGGRIEYTVVGPAYAHGFMDGQGMGFVEEEQVVLV